MQYKTVRSNSGSVKKVTRFEVFVEHFLSYAEAIFRTVYVMESLFDFIVYDISWYTRHSVEHCNPHADGAKLLYVQLIL